MTVFAGLQFAKRSSQDINEIERQTETASRSWHLAVPTASNSIHYAAMEAVRRAD